MNTGHIPRDWPEPEHPVTDPNHLGLSPLTRLVCFAIDQLCWRCFGEDMPVRVYPAPNRGALAVAWEKALRRWIHQRDDWRAKFKAGRRLMKNPPGAASGRKWLPLARWVGWPERALHTLAGLIWCESSGIKTNVSPTGDWGLTQLNRLSWEAKFRKVMHAAWSKTLNPEYNLRFALWVWKSQGGRFKPAWRGDKAVEAVE